MQLSKSTLNILEPGSHLAHGVPLFRLGFRPFYLCAAAFAALAIPVWVLAFLGIFTWAPAFPALYWHAHEMLFGFAGAVVIGFLLTAGKAWTGQPTPRGPQLAALAALWLAARLAAVLAPPAVFAVIDMLLLPVVAAVLITLFLRAGNRRNLPVAGILVLLALANLAFHLASLGLVDWQALTALHAALALIVVLACVIGGRVIPGFTQSANPGLKVKPLPWLERTTLLGTVVALALWVFSAPAALCAAALAFAAVCHAVRQWRWSPLLTRNRPILWILHAAYAWIALGFGWMALGQLGLVPPSAGLHALTVGAMGGLIIAMITRTARGHTGRLLQAGRAEVTAYGLVLAAAVVRVLVPTLWSALIPASLIVAALCWTTAFGLYVWTYGPWLMRPRVDGKDG